MSTNFLFSSLMTMHSNVLPIHLKQTFPPIFWISTEGEGDGIKFRLPFKIFSTLNKIAATDQNTKTADFFPFVKILIMYVRIVGYKKLINVGMGKISTYLLATVEFLISCPPFFVINVCSTGCLTLKRDFWIVSER